MRVTIAASVTAAALILTGPASAQTAATPRPWPSAIPGTKDNDPDLVCFSVLASKAEDAKRAGKNDPTFDAGAGYFGGVVGERYQDDEALAAAMEKMLADLGTSDTSAFSRPCLERLLKGITRLQSSLPKKRT